MDASMAQDPLIKSAVSRDAFCSNSLRVSQLEDLRFNDEPEAHFCVSLIGDTAKCMSCQAPQLCRCLRDHFQSTANSKRRVSTFLYWKNKLGLHFPVGDSMLVRTVWSSLESCKCGIKQGNGQRKLPKGSVCINPYHYHATNFIKIMTPLMAYLQELGMHKDRVISSIAQHLGWNGENFSVNNEELAARGFQLLTTRIRQMVEDEGYFANVIPQAPAANKKEKVDYDSAYESAASCEHSPGPADVFHPDSPPDVLVSHAVPGSRESSPPAESVVVPNITVPPSPPVTPPVTSYGKDYAVPRSPQPSVPTYNLPELPMDELMSELATAQHMLPLLHQRQWSPDQAAEIEAISDGLREFLENDDMEAEQLSQVVPQQQPQQHPGASWGTYMSTNVMNQSGSPAQFSCGFNVLQNDAYGHSQLGSLPGMPQVDFSGMMQSEAMNFFSSQSMTQARAVGFTSGFQIPFQVQGATGDIYRAFCKGCQKWSYSEQNLDCCKVSGCSGARKLKAQKVPAKTAADVPRMQVDPNIEVGDVVSLVEKGNATFVVKLDHAIVKNSTSIGVVCNADSDGNRSKGLRIGLIGLVDVKVAGPVVPLDMIYGASTDMAGVATAGRGTTESSCLLGQTLRVNPELANAKPTDVNLVRCLVVPPSMNMDKKLLAAMIIRLNKVITSKIKDSIKTTADSSYDDVLASVTKKVAELQMISGEGDVPCSYVYRKCTESIDDESVITIFSHSSAKPLRVLADGSVDDAGSHSSPESQFVVVRSEDEERVVQLQSVCDDNKWLRLSDKGLSCCGPDDESTKLRLQHDSNGIYSLCSGDLMLCASGDKLVGSVIGGADTAIKFSLYIRVACA